MWQQCLPSVSIGRYEIDLIAGTRDLQSDPPSHSEQYIGGCLLEVAPYHPTMLSYLERPNDPSPRRVSDFMSIRQLKGSAFYRNLCIPMGIDHHVSFRFGIPTPAGAAGWSFSRLMVPYSDEDLTLITACQPVLDAIDRIRASRQTPDRPEAVRTAYKLTPVETRVLRLLADGLSARQIASVRRVSVRTVQKQTESLFSKLKVHDRVAAIRVLLSQNIT